jgi:hypothetical protein
LAFWGARDTPRDNEAVYASLAGVPRLRQNLRFVVSRQRQEQAARERRLSVVTHSSRAPEGQAATETRGVGRPPIHGAQSRKVQVERAQEVAEWILTMPHTAELDWAAASEMGRLFAMAEALDADLATRGVTTGSGAVRGAATLRLSISKAIMTWCNTLGMTPRARAEIAAALGQSGLAGEIARRRALNGAEL